MNMNNLKYLAETGSVKDLVGLLKEFGDKKTDKGEDCIDWIVSGVSESAWNEIDRKKALVADYLGKQGVFAETGAMPADATRQVQETLIQLLETVRELTEKVGGLETEIKDLKKTVTEKPVPPRTSFPSIH
ncbi:MAG: hypothetical protein KGL10_09445 [Alphaproteobacteria bacterium]|nr:hypothetical protein [Alphaproteobacteria bacterium]MDE2337523.1 hypothetical protein [Alphaproteobacteria bacterium]